MCNHPHPLRAHAAGLACAAVSAIGFVLCAIAYVLAPSATITFFNLLFHGIDFSKVAKPMTVGGVIGGLILIAALSYIGTWLWAALYNRLIGTPSSAADQSGGGCCAK